jgi:hypothetical protein
MTEKTNMTEHATIAVAFAQALVDGDFDKAHALLTPDLQGTLTPGQIHRELHKMFELYADGKPRRIWFDQEFSCAAFPNKLADDLGWDYVGIEGDDFVEAVTVIVTNLNGKPLIRHIEWGRP